MQKPYKSKSSKTKLTGLHEIRHKNHNDSKLYKKLRKWKIKHTTQFLKVQSQPVFASSPIWTPPYLKRKKLQSTSKTFLRTEKSTPQ